METYHPKITKQQTSLSFLVSLSFENKRQRR